MASRNLIDEQLDHSPERRRFLRGVTGLLSAASLTASSVSTIGLIRDTERSVDAALADPSRNPRSEESDSREFMEGLAIGGGVAFVSFIFLFMRTFPGSWIGRRGEWDLTKEPR